MDPKRVVVAPFFGFQSTASIVDRLWSCFASPWVPFGLPFGSFWLLLASILAPFGLLWAPGWCFLSSFGFLSASLEFFGPPKFFFASGSEILARSCQDLAEILLRTFQEFAKNQPRTRRMNHKQSCLSNSRFFETTSFPDKPFHNIAQNKMWGGGVHPWGASIPIILARWRTLPYAS